MTMMIIRLAEKKDKEEILYLFKKLDKKHSDNVKEFKAEIPDERYRDILFKGYKSSDYIINVGEFENKIIGFSLAKIKFLNNHFYLKDCTIGEILYLFVDDSFRRRGVGAKILNDIENRLFKQKVERIEITVYDFNEEAQPSKLGYKPKFKIFQKNFKVCMD